MFVAKTSILNDMLSDTGFDWNGKTMRATLLVRSSGFYDDDPVVEGVSTLIELLTKPGWQAAPVGSETLTVSSYTTLSTGTKYVSLATTGPFSDDFDPGAFDVADVVPFRFVCPPFYLSAIALSLVGTYDGTVEPLLAVYRLEDAILFGGSEDREGLVLQNNGQDLNWAFSYSAADGTTVSPLEVATPVLGWESPHAAHVWLSPSRINYVANPSFESLGTGGKLFGWRSNSTLARAEVDGTNWGHLSGSNVTKTIESNLFPASNESGFWSVQAKVRGQGSYRIGVVFWLPGMDEADCEFVSESFTVTQDGEQVLKTVMYAPEEAWEAQFRLEYVGSECWVDNVMVDPNEAQDVYFDGSTVLGQPGDAHWYNSENNPASQIEHKSFSTYYPERDKTRRYLFGYSTTEFHDAKTVTGTAFDYVPETNQIVAHWDDVYYSRIHSWTRDVRIPVADFPALGKGVVVTLST